MDVVELITGPKPSKVRVVAVPKVYTKTSVTNIAGLRHRASATEDRQAEKAHGHHLAFVEVPKDSPVFAYTAKLRYTKASDLREKSVSKGGVIVPAIYEPIRVEPITDEPYRSKLVALRDELDANFEKKAGKR